MIPPTNAPRPAAVVELVRPFDPMSAEAEEYYDAVVRRLNRLRVRRAEIMREFSGLERRFLESKDDDGGVRPGSRRDRAAALRDRRERLERMLDLGAILRRLEAEEEFATADLERMNEALDRWARETWGPA